eukprot:scaffold3559_cov284-Chaetoceros_neogracile.AAC.26
MNTERNNRNGCIAILHGTHLGLLVEPGIDKSDDLSVPSVPLHLVHSFYDSFLDTKSSDCDITTLLPNGQTFDEDSISEMGLSRHNYHSSITTNKPGDFSAVQYPFYREEEFAVAGIGIEIHVKKDPIEINNRNSYSLYLLKDDSIEPQDTPFLKIHSSGYIICEMKNANGYEQILFLPPHLENDLGPANTLPEQKQRFLQIIQQCVLVDGLHLLCHSSNILSVSGNISSKTVRYCNSDNSNTFESSFINRSCSSSIRATGTDTSVNDSLQEAAEKKWQLCLRLKLRKRFNHCLYLQKKDNHIGQIHKHLNFLSRRILKNTSITSKISNDLTKDIVQGLKLIRMRYTVEPFTGAPNSSSVHLHMEIDIAFDAGPLPFLHNLHISLSPKTKHNQKLSVSTRSGVIPTMRKGHCFRMMALATMSGINVTSLRPDNACEELLLSVFFSHDLGSISKKKENMKSMVLGLITIPHKSTILKPHGSMILFPNGQQGSRCGPTAIFDYRMPCSLSIDISACFSNTIQDTWQRIVDSFNMNCTFGNHVDILFDRQTIVFSIFASSPEHRFFVLQELIRSTPLSAQISWTSSGAVDANSSMTLLLQGMQKELVILENQASSRYELSSGGVRELLRTQFENDRLASHLDQSWCK